MGVYISVEMCSVTDMRYVIKNRGSDQLIFIRSSLWGHVTHTPLLWKGVWGQNASIGVWGVRFLLWRGVWGRNVSTTEHTRGSMRTRIVALCALTEHTRGSMRTRIVALCALTEHTRGK